MEKRFKKIYIEVTNICNLNCLFCPGNKRDKKFMNINDFKIILDKIKDYTNYVYFHLMGEPLMHPEINTLINIASLDFKVNITTNGYMIDRIKNNKNIRQVNISLQSFDSKNNISLNEYMLNIFKSVDNLLESGTIVNYRLWVFKDINKEIIEKIEKYYNVKINGNTKIKERLFIDFSDSFIWPDINNSYYNEEGSCLGLIKQLGILVDGSVVPCCLDYNGNLTLGNIFKDNLEEILESSLAKEMVAGFRENKKVEEMCRHCNFYQKKKSQK